MQWCIREFKKKKNWHKDRHRTKKIFQFYLVMDHKVRNESICRTEEESLKSHVLILVKIYLLFHYTKNQAEWLHFIKKNVAILNCKPIIHNK